MKTNHVWKIIGQIAALTAAKAVSEKREESVRMAIEADASDSLIVVLVEARRVSRTDTVVLPQQRFEQLSRGKGWCRKGRGSSAEWGERDDSGYRVGPGRWTVGGNDGFSRKGEDVWLVKNVTVGDKIWTIAD